MAARHGVSHLWLVDPLERTLEVLRLENGRWVELDTFVDQQAFRAEPFEQLEITLGALWV